MSCSGLGVQDMVMEQHRPSALMDITSLWYKKTANKYIYTVSYWVVISSLMRIKQDTGHSTLTNYLRESLSEKVAIKLKVKISRGKKHLW